MLHFRNPDDSSIPRMMVDTSPSHRPGRPLRINLMSRYICFSQIGPFDVSFEELFSKAKNPGGFFRKNVYLYLQKYPILAVFGPSCQPGRFFLVQNGWKRCPPYRYMFHVGLAPLGGLLGPNIQFFQK